MELPFEEDVRKTLDDLQAMTLTIITDQLMLGWATPKPAALSD